MLLIIADKTLIKVAERNMQGILPLYYNMKKAASVQIDSDEIYKGLTNAFTYGNIGPYSNNITRILNDKVWQENDEAKKNEALMVIKWLCMENNFCIDFAKTLYMPERPQAVHDIITKYTKAKMPYFFKYAKDYLKDQIEPLNNSTVNRLYNIIPNQRLSFDMQELAKFDYKMLMNDTNIQINQLLIDKFIELNQTYHYKVRVSDTNSAMTNIKMIVEYIRNELAFYCSDEVKVCDMLIKYLFSNDITYKEMLWSCYGHIIVDNLKRNVPESSICKFCGKRFKADDRNDVCHDCMKDIKQHEKICIDCGTPFTIKRITGNSVRQRCVSCQKNYNRKIRRKK